MQSNHIYDLARRLAERHHTLAAIWAHPDDESYCGAGLMAAAARCGIRVVNVTATLGEHGTQDPAANPPGQLAVRRGEELTLALDRLGVHESVVLGYEDGECTSVPDELGARRIRAVLDEVGADMVLTFGPDGVTGHPDHRAIARWTARAVATCARPAPLITSAAATVWPSDLVARMHRVDAFYPGYPEVAAPESRVAFHLGRELLNPKLAALRAHASQVGPLATVLGSRGYRRLASHEAYVPVNAAARTAFGLPARPTRPSFARAA